jgi:glycosyltransferase involved in cell wall biosynthesis
VEFALDRRRETPTGPWLRLLSLRGPAADPDHAHFRRIAGKARRRMPENFEVMVKIAAWAIDRNLLDFALETLKLVPFEHQGRPDVRVQTARLAIEMGDAQRGLKLAEHLTVPPTVQAFGLRLLALVELGRFRDALELVGEGIPDVRTIEWATFHLFEAYGASRHELPEFIEALETLAEAYFNDYTSTKIRLLTRARRYDMAVELCQGLIAECRSSEKAAVAVAEAYLRSGQWLQGRAALQAALEGLGQHPKMAREARQAIETLDMLEGFYRDAPHSVPRDYALPAALFEYLYLDRPAPEDTPPPVLDLALVAARLDRTPGSRTLLNARRAVWPQPGLETELWLQSAPAALPDDPLVRRGRAEDIAVLDGGAKVAAPYDRLPLNIARNVAALGQQIERRRPRILHAWQDAANLEAGLAGVAAGVDRIVLHSHNLQPDVPSADLTVPAFRRAYRALLSRPEVRFICSSHAAMAAYAKVLNLTPDPRHHVVHNGFDWSRAPDPAARAADGARLRAAHGLPADAVVVGGWCPLADHARPQLWIETAIRAAGHDARLHFLLGGAGPALPALQARVREFGLSNRILFAGDAQPAVKMAPAFDLLLHTPPFEALPTVPIEALGNAVPVIAPAFGGAFECVPPRSNLDALSLVEDDTAEAFVAALLRMHREGPGPEAMAKVAEEVRAYFSIPRMTRELYRIYTS